MPYIIAAAFSAFFFWISGSAVASQIQQKDIVYDVVTERDASGVMRTETLRLDLYRPRRVTGPTPLLVYIHGGCFVRGSKTKIPTFIKNLADAGIAVASIDYRLARDPLNPQAEANWIYPAALKDVQQALRFLRKNKDLYRLDPDRVAAHGESAGGYLASALGLRPATDRQGNSDSYARRVDAVSDWYGRSDFTLPKSPSGEPCHEYWIGQPYSPATRSLFEEAGLLPHVDSRSARSFQIMHGSRDPQVDFVHSVALAEKLRAAGVRADLYLNEGWPHGFSGSLPAEAVTRDFIARALGTKPAGQPVLTRLQINAGRTDTKDPGALPELFKVDQYMNPRSPGLPILYAGCVGHPTLPKLHWDARYGKKFGYKVPVANGVYRVRLHFAECRFTKIGQRRFKASLYGIPMLRDYDMLKATGGRFATADVRDLHVIVRNGVIDLSFASITNTNASLSALEIEQLM